MKIRVFSKHAGMEYKLNFLKIEHLPHAILVHRILEFLIKRHQLFLKYNCIAFNTEMKNHTGFITYKFAQVTLYELTIGLLWAKVCSPKYQNTEYLLKSLDKIIHKFIHKPKS